MKTASLLYQQVLLEAGSLTIQAGASGASAFRSRGGAGPALSWQTPRARNRAQQAPFAIAMARETTPGVPAPGPYRTVLHSKTTISWNATLEPFASELPPDCDWIAFGHPSEPAPPFKLLQDQWRREDDRNEALARLVPEHFVRSRLVQHVAGDLTAGISGGWDVSVDRFHGLVIGARFAPTGPFASRGFALPILVPRVGDLTWDEVARIRRLRAITQLREVLREVESEAFDAARAGGDVEAALHGAYTRRVLRASEGVAGIRSVAATAVMELTVGSGAGYAMTGLALLGPLAGAGITAAVMTGWHVRRIVRERRQRAWVGVMDTISEAATTQQTSMAPPAFES